VIVSAGIGGGRGGFRGETLSEEAFAFARALLADVEDFKTWDAELQERIVWLVAAGLNEGFALAVGALKKPLREHVFAMACKPRGV
jgi:hypothetical protein